MDRQTSKEQFKQVVSIPDVMGNRAGSPTTIINKIASKVSIPDVMGNRAGLKNCFKAVYKTAKVSIPDVMGNRAG